MDYTRKRIQLLECTIRDGCLGLEDAWNNGIANIQLSESERKQLGELIASSGIDIVEIGSIQITENDRSGFAIYQNIEEVSNYIPNNLKSSQQCVALFRGPDTLFNDIPYKKDSMVDGVRVILRYSELKKSLDFCSILADKGFKVYIQPMVTSRYSEKELELIIQYANAMNAYALYFVDSYGYMMPEDVLRFCQKYDSLLEANIKIGFHAHNNINMAFSNAITFLNFPTERDIILDSTMTGMGQGAGNLQTEIIAAYLIRKYGKRYNYNAVLEACDFVERYNESGIWGYSVMRFIPAIHGAAYKYATYLRKKCNLSYTQIHKLFKILDTMPDDIRYRYTKENVLNLLRIGNISVGDYQ